MSRTLLALIFVCCLVPTRTSAQTVNQAEAYGAFLDKSGVTITQAVSNLEQIGRGLPDREFRSVAYVLVGGLEAAAMVARTADIAHAYSSMQGSADSEVLRRDLSALAGGLVASCDTEIQKINFNLGSLKSPAAVAESQKVRDSIQGVRDQSDHFYKSHWQGEPR